MLKRTDKKRLQSDKKDTVGIFSENFSKNFCGDGILCEKNPQRIIRVYVGELFCIPKYARKAASGRISVLLCIRKKLPVAGTVDI